MSEPAAQPSLAESVGETHVPALDGLRAIAALVVVLFHARWAFQAGDLGVDMFFVLSGFLITGILLRDAEIHGRIRLARFYRRRALRLLPAYLAVLVTCVVLDRIWDVGGTLKGAVFSFFYVSNWAAATGTGLGSLLHTWSLSIEEQFYLVWPVALIAILALGRGSTRALILGVGACLALAYASIVIGYLAGASPVLGWNSTPARGTELLAGCLLAVVLRSRRAATWWSSLGASRTGAIGLACLVLLVVLANVPAPHPWLTMFWRWPAVSLLTAGVIAACVAGGRGMSAALGNRVLVAIGRMSYGLYLWHFPVFVTVDSTLGLTGVAPRLLALAITAAVVPLSYRYVEQPFLRMKNRRPVPVP
ncbi:acyltransferase family protein [Aeromicrobium chenweiae]|uniref:Uncharacterized protein n=1 Tax=Aeromicrobium chenweiae TaxID=2079793 RepID=A0A2S0WI69_9ACTN|nr:acyltransferase [Aeromicrobium chenweiae]AWB91007.1 hypothetical protein C3E78_01540 [Aeromicrobium chenweiae]TGN31911.1 acyltransferase [Aeromicrobium chenweiae]